jgi:hypothetical protein
VAQSADDAGHHRRHRDVSLTLPAGSYRCDFAAASGAVESQGITCDPAATASLKISVDSGDIHLQGTAP